MDVNCGDFKLIYSNSIIQVYDLPIKVTLIDKVEGNFNFIFKFINDRNKVGMSSVFKTIDIYTIEISFINYNTVNTVGNKELIRIGTFERVPLFLNYRVNDIPGLGKSLIVNFYTNKNK